MGPSSPPAARTGCVVWFTGLSGAGKTTIAHCLESRLIAANLQVFLLDGDALRKGLCSDLGFSKADRHENLRRAAEVAAMLAESGSIVLAAFITPIQADREWIRGRLRHVVFMEVFVDTPLHVAEARDPKGLYARARRGEIENFTGIDSPFEDPTSPDICLRTVGETPDALACRVMAELDLVGHAVTKLESQPTCGGTVS